MGMDFHSFLCILFLKKYIKYGGFDQNPYGRNAFVDFPLGVMLKIKYIHKYLSEEKQVLFLLLADRFYRHVLFAALISRLCLVILSEFRFRIQCIL